MCSLQIQRKSPFLVAIFLLVLPLSTRRRPVYGKKATKRAHAGDKNKRDDKKAPREGEARQAWRFPASKRPDASCKLPACLLACRLAAAAAAAAHPSLSRLGGRFSTLLGAETQHAAGLEQSWD